LLQVFSSMLAGSLVGNSGLISACLQFTMQINLER
jgi:hypothetical protein